MEQFGFGPIAPKRNGEGGIVPIRSSSGLVLKERFVHERPTTTTRSAASVLDLPFEGGLLDKLRMFVIGGPEKGRFKGQRKLIVIIYFFLGAAVFLVGVFFALGLAAAGFFGFAGDFFGLVALGLAATAFLTFLAAGSPAAGFTFLADVDFLFVAPGALTFLTTGFFFLTTAVFFLGLTSATGSLKCPDAPVPLVWRTVPLATAAFKNFLMNGANLAGSTL
ncbi:hypothetical protein AGLY_000887 [Aphis glycines]|uniref:Uncharacterized protein n=1 Tax=Aphis glycines TaxID=307491 RepID=A0A6G0U8E3_APHGL|nr:hypothetical protein AGLY_000887 [Aphis glycines]